MTEGKRTVELPGLVDLQVNGFAGVDFGDPALRAERLLHAVRRSRRRASRASCRR